MIIKIVILEKELSSFESLYDDLIANVNKLSSISYIHPYATTFLLNAFQVTFSGLLNERIYDYGKTPVKDCVVLKIRERTSVDFAYPIKFYPIW